MNERKLTIITCTAIWLVSVAGSIYGLLLTIAGYLLDWGPGGSMHGPIWKILLSGLLSVFVGAFIGVILVKMLARLLLGKQLSLLDHTIRSFAVVLIGGMAAFVSSWVIGFLVGKITGTIEGLDWITVLVYTPLMSFLYGMPVCLSAAAVFGAFVYFYLKTAEKKVPIP